MRIARIAIVAAMTGPPPVVARKEDGREAARELDGNLAEREPPPRAGRTLDAEFGSLEVVVALQRFDEQIVQRKPDRYAPVRIASEKP